MRRHRHKKNKNVGTWVAIIIILAGLVWAYNEGYFDNILDNLKSNQLSIKEFNRNKSAYLGETVEVRGEYTGQDFVDTGDCAYSLKTLKDSEGYMIQFCPSTKRDFEGLKSYSVKGTIEKIETTTYPVTYPPTPIIQERIVLVEESLN